MPAAPYTLVAPLDMEKHRSIRLPIADNLEWNIEGVHTVTFHRGQVDLERMKTAISAVLEAAPIFGGRISSITPEWLLVCPGIFFGCNTNETCSVWKVKFPRGQCGAILTSRTMDPSLEYRLAATEAPDPLGLTAADLNSLVDKVGNGSSVDLKGAAGASMRIRISQGDGIACVGFSTSHVLGDGRTHYTLLGLLNDAYSSEIQPPKLPKVAHLDNSQARPYLPALRPWRSALSPIEYFKRVLGLGICIGQICCQAGSTMRVFTISLTPEALQDAKTLAAARHPGLPPPHSANDALIEIFSPSTASGTYNFTTIFETRGRLPGMPAPTERLTSGNGDLALSSAVPGGDLSHRLPRELYDDWRVPRSLDCCALVQGKDFGWNSWATVSRDHSLELRGLELLLHHQAVVLDTPGQLKMPPWQMGFPWQV